MKPVRTTALFLCMLSSSLLAGCSNAPPVSKPVLIYLHGRIIEDMGRNAVSERFGPYRFDEILRRFEEEGFRVQSEVRKRGTDPKKYGKKLASKIAKKIDEGHEASSITVVGASKGALIAMIASSELKNRSVNFVLMGNCNDWVKENYEIDLHGRVLSVFEKTDSVGGGSCGKIRNSSSGLSEFKEIEINTGLDHGFLFTPNKAWFVPVIEWARTTR